MWRSRPSFVVHRAVVSQRRALHRGRRRARCARRSPTTSQHYRSCCPATRASSVEVREDEQVGAPDPRARATSSLLDAGGQRVRLGGLRALARGAPPGRPRPLLRDRRPVRASSSTRADQRLSLRADDAARTSSRASCCSSSSTGRTRSSRASRTITDRDLPSDELRAAVEAAAGDLRDGGRPPAARPTLERPKKAGFGDYSTNAAMLLAPGAGRAAARRSPSGSARRCATGSASGVERVEVAGPGFLNLFLADAWYAARRRRACSPRATPTARRRRRAARADQRRVRLRQPDRAADRRERPPRRLRRRARAAARAAPATRSTASTTSTTPARRSSASASRSGPARAARSRRRTATRATTWPSSRRQIPGAAELDAGELARGRRGADDRAHPRDARALPRATSTAGSSSARSTRATRAPIERALARAGASRATSTSPRARCGCARPSSATTRTACSCAPTGEPTYFAADVAYHEDKLDARLRPPDQRPRRRPPRLRRRA